MNIKRFCRLVCGWLGTVRGAALATALVTALFVGMHLLGLSDVRELSYTLLLLCAGMLCAGIVSFRRYAQRQLRLWGALASPPPDMDALPEGNNEIERCYRALAVRCQAAQREALGRAAAAERERLDYFTLWVHQIKTPISALDLMAQSEEAVSRELLRQEAFKIGQYADAALSYLRLQSLPNDLALAPVPLYPLCCTLVKRLRPLFLYRRIGLVMQPFAGEALSDAKWLGMAILQTLTNALKFTPEGGTVEIALCEPLVLTVRDSGPGIPAEDLPRVFELGFTGAAGRGPSGEKSSGLGLYLCKRACDRLGHGLTITSPPGGGVCVTFDLRRQRFDPFA